MYNAIRHFLWAVQFFSRIPLPARLQNWASFQAQESKHLMTYWPALGLLLGLICALLLLTLCYGFSVGLRGLAEPDTHGAGLAGPGPDGSVASLTVLTLPCLPPASAFLVVVLCMVCSLWLSGGLHEDGLADAADGLMSGASRERALSMMQDPHCGSFAVLTLIAVWSLRAALLWQLCMLQPWWAALAWVYAAVGSRALPLWLAATLPYARSEGKSTSRDIVQGFSRRSAAQAQGWWLATVLAMSAITTLLALIHKPPHLAPVAAPALTHASAAAHALLAHGLTFGRVFFGLLLAALPALCLLRHLRQRYAERLGGCTGDTLGASQQLLELALLFGALIAFLLL